jgi:hypothetical protein
MRIAALRVFLALMLTGSWLASADTAAAGCGDVTADKNVSAADALSVLRAAVGQPVNLNCTYDDVMLDPFAAPQFGEVGLTSGFTPQPYSLAFVAGGPVFTGYFGLDCYGWTDSAPSVRVHYISGASPLLRFFWAGDGDATMVVRDPNGAYRCDNDGFVGTDTKIDFTNPWSGTYDIWVGTLGGGQSLNGGLFVTEYP